ncbi:hypothetical protein F2P56_003660 [Juglans regia]|uniref:Uncharacterized protein n=1 Tax=Juglans regia TaxID=51240 RepID=A0A834D738_JUGRE|nr:hypothetical protein F2P56_003660 [Juglans regia]
MPKNQAAWSAWNFLGSRDNKVCLTYWLNVLQNIGETDLPFLVTLNPDHTPKSFAASSPISCLSGQLLIQSHQLLHQKLRLSLIISKGREEFGFVGHTKVMVSMRMD